MNKGVMIVIIRILKRNLKLKLLRYMAICILLNAPNGNMTPIIANGNPNPSFPTNIASSSRQIIMTSHNTIAKTIFEIKATLTFLTRKERTHRLCTRGGMLESFLQEPERLTDDDVMLLLKLIFHRQDTQELLKKLLEREMPEPP